MFIKAMIKRNILSQVAIIRWRALLALPDFRLLGRQIIFSHVYKKIKLYRSKNKFYMYYMYALCGTTEGGGCTLLFNFSYLLVQIDTLSATSFMTTVQGQNNGRLIYLFTNSDKQKFSSYLLYDLLVENFGHSVPTNPDLSMLPCLSFQIANSIC